MYRALLLVVFVLSTLATVSAQLPEWIRVHKSQGFSNALGLIQLGDTGFMIAGNSTQYAQAKLMIHVNRTDAVGLLRRQQIAFYSGEYLEYLGQFQTSTGYALVGRTGRGMAGFGTLYVGVDTNLRIVAPMRTFGRAASAPYAVSRTRDGGYIVAGSYRENTYLLRLSNNGDSLWDRSYDLGESEHGSAVIETSDGGFVVTGPTNARPGYSWDMLLLKVSANGDSLWQRTLGTTSAERGYSVVETEDRGVLIGGVSEPADEPLR